MMMKSQLRCRAVAGASLLLFSMAGLNPANADAIFCNKTSYDMKLAFRNTLGPSEQSTSETFGWTDVRAYDCFKFYRGDAANLDFFVAGFYRHGSVLDPVNTEEGTTFHFCVSASNFRYKGEGDACPSGYYKMPFQHYRTAASDAKFSIN